MGNHSLSTKNVTIIGLVLSAVICVSMAGQPETVTFAPDPSAECQKHNNSCSDCVSQKGCYYCFPTDTCDVYPWDTLKPYDKCGDIKDMALKTCLVSYKTLLITLVSVGTALLVVGVCLCCCLCRKCRTATMQRQLDKWDRQRMDMKARHEERRQDREGRRQELRDKYGIGSSNPYNRF